MGSTCSCADKDDTEQEVRVDPVSLFSLGYPPTLALLVAAEYLPFIGF